MGVRISAAFAAAISAATLTSVSAFAAPSLRSPRRARHTPARAPALRLAAAPPDANADRFQALLRDLQNEGVPLLGCDADQVSSFQAATWTTLADLGADDAARRACLVLEGVPVGALAAFAEDFAVLRTQDRLMARLPELRRCAVSVVGGGAGSALLVETTARTEEERAAAAAQRAVEATFDEGKTVAALKSFISRVVVGMDACPYTKSADVSAVGLEQRGVAPGPVAYRYSPTTDVCATLSTFWNCICEVSNAPETELSSVMLSLPGIGAGGGRAAHDRFAAVVELVGRYLCLFRGDGSFGLVHFHPLYHRSSITPMHMPAYGHLPPTSWLRPMLKMGGHGPRAEELTDDDLQLSNYQRRAPHTAINILRMTQVNAAAGAKSIVDLDLGDGRVEKASGIPLYSRNTLRMISIGDEALSRSLGAEIAMQH